MKYTVKEVNTLFIKVEYEDGSNAQVPIAKGQTSNDIRFNIKNWSNSTHIPFDKVSDVPLAVDFAGDTDDDLTVANEYNYKEIREVKYPNLGDQMDAAYKARLGDTSEQTTIDAAIKAVKDKYPKDDTKYTDSDLL